VTKDLQRILEAAASRAGVLATVVRVEGSAYRRPGARMYFPDGRAPVGLVSGGCLEADLAERAARVRESDGARVVVYDMRSPDDIVWGLGLGCNGEVRVLLERVEPDDVAQGWPGFVGDLLGRRGRGVLATLISAPPGTASRPGGRLAIDSGGSRFSDLGDSTVEGALAPEVERVLDERRSRVGRFDWPGGEYEVLFEHLAPAPRLLVFGAGGDAAPVVRLASRSGWIVEVADHREAFASASRFPEADRVHLIEGDTPDLSPLAIDADTFAIVMSHHFLRDRAVLGPLLESPVRYIGLLGPRQRAENLLRQLAREGRSVDTDDPRIHGPVGLDIGAETPDEIALSVVAEIQAVLSGRAGGSLRERRAPLHDWPS
jgi:xanthine/CO dehydrogenase XdhC/CoxF family maturation factor